MIGALTNHLWQSTLFAVAAGLLTIAFRKNRAQVRYGLWLCASFKFLIPFILLLSLGSYLDWTPAQKIASQSVSFTMVQISQPFLGTLPLGPATRGAHDWVLIAILGVWAGGFSGVALMRFRGWLRILAAVRASKPMDILAAVAVRSSPGLLEPGVVGLFHPILLLPADIMQRLTPSQLEAVLAHELWHVRRRDNLTSAIHMVVEAAFWFYPLVWWISARLVEERERACDEEVLRRGAEPATYAEAILNVCTSYLESPLSSVSGVTGSNLKRRIQAILTGGAPRSLSSGKKVALAAVGMAALAVPVLIGMMNATSIRAQSQLPAADSPWVKPSGLSAHPGPGVMREQAKRSPDAFLEAPAGGLNALGVVTAFYTVTVKPRIDGQLISVSFNEGDLVQAGQVLASIDPQPYQIQVAQAEGQLARDQAQLASAMLAQNAIPNQQLATVAQLQGSIKADQANVNMARLQLTYAQVTAPIAGVVGLRVVDPGNIVHAADTTGLLTINQLQPIAVLFNITDESLPKVLARLRGASSLTVEAWNHARTVKIATGRLTAVDNQIDPATGTVKLKAVFDNKDGALFPNQFVFVRLFLNVH